MHSVSLEEAAVRTVRYLPDPFVRPLSHRAPILFMSPLYPTLQGQSLYEITGRDRRLERVNCSIGGPWPSSRWAVTLLFMDRPSFDLPAPQRRSLSPNRPLAARARCAPQSHALPMDPIPPDPMWRQSESPPAAVTRCRRTASHRVSL